MNYKYAYQPCPILGIRWRIEPFRRPTQWIIRMHMASHFPKAGIPTHIEIWRLQFEMLSLSLYIHTDAASNRNEETNTKHVLFFTVFLFILSWWKSILHLIFHWTWFDRVVCRSVRPAFFVCVLIRPPGSATYGRYCRCHRTPLVSITVVDIVGIHRMLNRFADQIQRGESDSEQEPSGVRTKQFGEQCNKQNEIAVQCWADWKEIRSSNECIGCQQKPTAYYSNN